MASGDKSTHAESSGTSGIAGRGSAGVSRARKVLGQLVWLLCLVAALFLAVGALLIALDANRDNQLVEFVLDGADIFDLGIFSLDNGIMKFEGENAETKNALFNWGLGAVVWLVVGRILDRLIRP
jgi:hypothetical protein